VHSRSVQICDSSVFLRQTLLFPKASGIAWHLRI
jgi:hypothetical protein